MVGGGGCGGTPLSFLALPPPALQAIAAAASTAKPGAVVTVRVPVGAESDFTEDPDSTDPSEDPRPPIREVDGPEAGFVCAKCRLAFPSDAALLAHQRLSCFAAAPTDARGGIRLVRALYECRICRERFPSIKAAKKHCSTKHPTEQPMVQQHQPPSMASERQSPATPVSPPAKPPSRGSSLLPPPPPGPSTSIPPPPPESPSVGLSYEMEDVVNQIAALAKAAAESTVDSNANISGGKEGGEGRSEVVGEVRSSPPSRPPSSQLAVPL
ncbi:hypothetical protein J437_LFUL009899 [Ladona fulva]|uniref:C2H2-type domain-containing protein n=1 Tax=Ladona fulva TaxID=123851 RepID=A0A8K0NSZ3_LADFU|nr:hypothetical protein J437_LFUL009899 [Ladona fulva]